ncbi:MAG: gamma-glutamyl-gamma-aminobutyrate hydrolase family protein [Deltaproteobacteria bacterium]|nr:gamma-glutamyl-gamma-aminobutyrate hydrolase family protein [Deltaproteobacteria bacterium]
MRPLIGIPPCLDDRGRWRSGIDGLLLPGGDDFPPPRPYPDGVSFELTPTDQIDFDGRLIDHAFARSMPVLAICYGMQRLALHAGGTLHADIATDLPDAAEHRLPEDHGRHALRVEADSRLAEILGVAPEPVNSLHHQAVATAGSLRISARAEDGVIEAVERATGPFCVGVQWHPEKLDGPHRERLMGAFIDACRVVRGDGGPDRRY